MENDYMKQIGIKIFPQTNTIWFGSKFYEILPFINKIPLVFRGELKLKHLYAYENTWFRQLPIIQWILSTKR